MVSRALLGLAAFVLAGLGGWACAPADAEAESTTAAAPAVIEPVAPPVACPEPLQSVETPTSVRARNAIERVRPRLTEELAARGLCWGAPVFVRIFKDSATLELWVRPFDELRAGRYQLFRTYEICSFSGRLGPKTRQGDLQAPEGFYEVRARQLNPASRFHLSFNLGYPNAYERTQGWTGSALMVHGDCVSIGCYAMTDPGIEEIYALVDAALRAGQPAVPVHAFPFEPDGAALAAREGERWHGFWSELGAGWQAFENSGRPPRIRVRDGHYVVEPTEEAAPG